MIPYIALKLEEEEKKNTEINIRNNNPFSIKKKKERHRIFCLRFTVLFEFKVKELMK